MLSQTPGQISSLDMSVLHISPLEGTELRQANTVLESELKRQVILRRQLSVMPSGMRMTRALDTIQSENVTVRKRIAEQEELLNARKKRRKGRRVASKGRLYLVLLLKEFFKVQRKRRKRQLLERIISSHRNAPLA